MASSLSAVLFTGPMFVGKTTTMFRAVAEHADKGNRSVIIKPGMDHRGGHDTIYTHDGAKHNRNISIIVADTLYQAFFSIPDNVKVIGIDEGQFFPDLHNLFELCRMYTYMRACEHACEPACSHASIYISALSEDFLQRPFASVERLLQESLQASIQASIQASMYASVDTLTVVALTGRCMGAEGCTNKSEHSIRSMKDDRLVVVGGSELYKAVCYDCLHE